MLDNSITSKEVKNNGIARFCIFIGYRGQRSKVVAIYNATWVNLQQTLWFYRTKMYN
jgi:hypothetical protein